MSEVSVKKTTSRSKIGLVLWLVAFISGATILFLYFKPPQRAGLQVQTGDISVDLILDGKLIGTTPYFSDQLEPGLHNLTLQPQDNLYLPFDRKVTLSRNFLTVVEWHPDTVPERAWGIFFEPQASTDKQPESQLEITSSPDNIVLKYDNTDSQVTPQTFPTSPQLHVLNFSLPSYESLTREVQVSPHQTIKIFVKLAKAKEEMIQNRTTADQSGWDSDPGQLRAALDPTTQLIGAKLKVTSTKFYVDKKEVLALRSQPDANSNVVLHVAVGETLSYLGDESGAFYKVQAGQKTAWAEKQFVKFVK